MATQSIVRMKKRKQFLNVAHQGWRIVMHSMIVQACPNMTDVVRIGFTVTKKVGCAVVRNRIRRRLREVVRLNPQIPLLTGLDFVIIGRQATHDVSFEALKQDLAAALNQIQDRREKKQS